MKLRIGPHLSTSGENGFLKAVERAISLGANTYQFFTGNPRGSSQRKLSEGEAKKLDELCRREDFGPLVGHVPYTVNAASSTDRVHQFAGDIIKRDLHRCRTLQVPFLVMHPGSHTGLGVEGGISRLGQTLQPAEELLNDPEFPTMLLLETMAGVGTQIGYRFEHLRRINEELNDPPNLGFCFDSCHLFGAGFDLTSDSGVEELYRQADGVLPLDKLKVFHLNDAKVEKGSNKDRHEVLGEGSLGKEGLKAIVNHHFWGKLPFILETPVDDYRDYAPQIELVKRMRKSE